MNNRNQDPVETWRPDQPYNQLPAIIAEPVYETEAVRAAIAWTDDELTALRRLTERDPAARRAIEQIMPHIEAQATSRIEGVHTTVTAMITAEAGRTAPDSVAMALRTEKAHLATAEAAAAQAPGHCPWTRWARRACSAMHNTAMELRTGGVGIWSRGQCVYTPPAGRARLQGMLKDWELLMDGNGPAEHPEGTISHPLVTMALGHYQFEAIHPFNDGNGRTGRILNAALLERTGLVSAAQVAPSREIAKPDHRERYYKLLRYMTEHFVWERWILFLIERLHNAAAETIAGYARHQKTIARQQGSARRDELDANVGAAVADATNRTWIDTDDLAKRHRITTAAAEGAMHRLADRGEIWRMPDHPNRYINNGIINAWTAP